MLNPIIIDSRLFSTYPGCKKPCFIFAQLCHLWDTNFPEGTSYCVPNPSLTHPSVSHQNMHEPVSTKNKQKQQQTHPQSCEVQTARFYFPTRCNSTQFYHHWALLICHYSARNLLTEKIPSYSVWKSCCPFMAHLTYKPSCPIHSSHQQFPFLRTAGEI